MPARNNRELMIINTIFSIQPFPLFNPTLQELVFF
jgi:hypothetical protein